ncbi:hypothetical protein P8452_69091 [Trifolium repens]|nr:hypothetical protein P8452_69091 [Trifolium repens]
MSTNSQSKIMNHHTTNDRKEVLQLAAPPRYLVLWGFFVDEFWASVMVLGLTALVPHTTVVKFELATVVVFHSPLEVLPINTVTQSLVLTSSTDSFLIFTFSVFCLSYQQTSNL